LPDAVPRNAAGVAGGKSAISYVRVPSGRSSHPPIGMPATGMPGARRALRRTPAPCRARHDRYPVEMISPRIDRLLENVDSNYASVLVAAKRARQINSYYHNLGEGTFDEFPPPMVDTGSKNYLTIALEEVAAGKIKYQYR
jgi:DNA-directed RNA polymerase subunit omega